ncbi:endonuclease III [Babesia caballi]|uniref:Endonuclease III n=1 Tax=Babesia caballi TaxID=5871 RepID=A0AAV4LU65_BABCB|nr:endonuclease III [Babesia caballi]
MTAFEALVRSLGELSKRKVKRSAHVWSACLGEIYNRRDCIAESQLPTIVRCIVDNQLEQHPKSRALLEHFTPLAPQLNSLEARDLAALCYAFCAVDQDSTAQTLLRRHWTSEAFVAADLADFNAAVRSVGLTAHRQRALNTPRESDEMVSSELVETYDKVVNTALRRLHGLHAASPATNECSEAGNLLLETVFLCHILNRSVSFFSGSNRWIDVASLDARIRTSHFLQAEHNEVLKQQIAAASYREILAVLRHVFYMRSPRRTHLQELFNRLCATAGASTRMCRTESTAILDYFIRTLRTDIDAASAPAAAVNSSKSLLAYLVGIRRAGVLSGGHVSSHRWNYPVMLSRHG